MINWIKHTLEKRRLFKDLETLDFNSCNIVVLTGAGISEESGISTFRDRGGLWENHRVEEVCRPESLASNPELVLGFYNKRREDYRLLNPRPNAAHLALKKLKDAFGSRLVVITQNVDGLHEASGVESIHVHGRLNQNLCSACKVSYPSTEALSFPNRCPHCEKQNSLRPDIVFFKENLQHTKEVESALNRCHLLISIGTSGVVYPVAYYPSMVQDHGGLSISLNKDRPSNDAYFNNIVLGKATELVPEVVDWIISRLQK